jgi:hypothetical protein
MRSKSNRTRIARKNTFHFGHQSPFSLTRLRKREKTELDEHHVRRKDFNSSGIGLEPTAGWEEHRNIRRVLNTEIIEAGWKAQVSCSDTSGIELLWCLVTGQDFSLELGRITIPEFCSLTVERRITVHY